MPTIKPMSVPARRLTRVLLLLSGLAAAALSASAVAAQGVPSTPGAIKFRCPGVTAVSATATVLQTAGGMSTVSITPLNPSEAAENPCLFDDSGPVLEWSSDHAALRMTAPGTWKDKLRVVLKDFDDLHAQYVANPRIKDMGMWPARLQETLELAAILTEQSGRDDARYYAQALHDEYKTGIYDQYPLLVMYGLQARERLGELAAPPAPVQPKVRR